MANMMIKKLAFIAILAALKFTLFAQEKVKETEARLGVTFIDSERVDDSYRLYSSRNLTTAHLITPEGKYVHSWYYPHSEDIVTNNSGGFGMSWHYAEMLPNGNLVAIVKDEMIIELDWNSNLVWKAKLRAHHDFARGKKGNTYVDSRRDLPNPWQPGKIMAFDQIVEFDKKGNEVWTWNYEEHMGEFEALIGYVPEPAIEKWRDYPHINTVEILPKNPLEKKDKRFSEGNILMCGRNSDVIWIVDRKTDQIVWAWGSGVLEGPHMPTMLSNGHILIYDNGHRYPAVSRDFTRAVEIEPISGEIVWEYGHKGGFWSPSRGSALRMAGGNTLIATSDFGWFFEITPAGERTWEYYNPDLGRGGNRMGLYRTLPYEKGLVDNLLSQNKSEYYARPGKEQFQEKHGLSDYFMKVISWIETGELDVAYRWLNDNGIAVIDARETHAAYSLLFSARGNIRRSSESKKKALEAGMPDELFYSEFSNFFKPLITSSK
jgi:hypothetical protein